MVFPTLYQKTSTDAIQQWTIVVNGNLITTTYGQYGGKMQVTLEAIAKGKNVGKKNATTPEEQAEKEAAARWTKQKKKGYVESLQEAIAGKVDASVIAGGVEPMLAHKYRDHARKIVFPCYVQPKLDGIRCLAVIRPNKDVTLWSRTRKKITSMPHIVRALQALDVAEEIVLDGELYNQDLHDNFNKIQSAVMSDAPVVDYDKLQYHCYDMVLPEDFEIRMYQLHDLLQTVDNNIVVRVPTCVVHDDTQLQTQFGSFLEQMYEGAMARNMHGHYEHKRSYNLQKLKTSEDAEFAIIGAEEGRGKDVGTVGSFICQGPSDTFNCRLKATYDYRRKLWENPAMWQGKLLTVTYQNLTQDGIPRFPIGKSLRDSCE